MAGRLSNPNQQFFDENGNPLDGGKLEFFITATSTPQDTFSDDGLTVANANPKILDGAGRAGDIFLTTADYKVVLKKSDDTVVWTADPVRAPTPKSTVVVDVSSATDVDTGDDGSLYAADATGGGFLVNLPAAVDAGDGFEISVIKIDNTTNVVTVDADGSETINGNSDYDLPTQYATVSLRCDGATWYVTAESVSRVNSPFDPDHIDGLTLETGTTPSTDINVLAGSCRSDADDANIISSTQISNKKINATFAEGSNQGMLDTSSVAADTSYDIYAVSKADGTADILATVKLASPTLPSGFINKRFIGRIATDGSSNLLEGQFLQQRIDGQHYRGEIDSSAAGTLADPLEIRALPDDPDKVDVRPLDVSSDANGDISLRLGGDTSIETTGYDGACFETGSTTAGPTDRLIYARNLGSTFSIGGNVRLRRVAAREYVCDGITTRGAASANYITGYTKTLTGQDLSAVDLFPSAGTFDSGKFVVTAFKASFSP